MYKTTTVLYNHVDIYGVAKILLNKTSPSLGTLHYIVYLLEQNNVVKVTGGDIGKNFLLAKIFGYVMVHNVDRPSLVHLVTLQRWR